jgi:hypothetical protein
MLFSSCTISLPFRSSATQQASTTNGLFPTGTFLFYPDRTIYRVSLILFDLIIVVIFGEVHHYAVFSNLALIPSS